MLFASDRMLQNVRERERGKGRKGVAWGLGKLSRMAWRHAISAAIKTKDTRHEQRQRQDALEWRIHIILTLERIRKPKRHWKRVPWRGWRVKGLSVWQIVDSRSISTIALTVAPRQRQQELPFIMLGSVWRVYHAIWFWPYAFSVCTLLPFAHCLPLFLATVNPLALTYVFPSHPVFFSHSSLCSGKLLSKAEKHRNQK